MLSQDEKNKSTRKEEFYDDENEERWKGMVTLMMIVNCCSIKQEKRPSLRNRGSILNPR